MTYNELQEFIRQSPEAGFRRLFDEYCNYVWAICSNSLKSCGTTEDIDECVSDAFAAVFRYVTVSDIQDGDLKGIIASIAKRTAIDYFRRLSSKNSRIVPMDEETLSRLPDTANVEDKAEQNLRREKLLDCIALLGELDSSIIVYFYYYGIKTHKIASLLGMSSSNVQQRLSRARKKLKKLLSEAGINEEGYL